MCMWLAIVKTEETWQWTDSESVLHMQLYSNHATITYNTHRHSINNQSKYTKQLHKAHIYTLIWKLHQWHISKLRFAAQW